MSPRLPRLPRCCSALPLLLAIACGVSYDLDRPIALRIDSPEVPETALAALRAALEQLGGREGGQDAAQAVSLRYEQEIEINGKLVDAGVNSRANSVIYLTERGRSRPSLLMYINMAHELGHVLGAEHLPSCLARNIMAQGCVVDPPLYSAADVAEICRTTPGGVCGRR